MADNRVVPNESWAVVVTQNPDDPELATITFVRPVDLEKHLGTAADKIMGDLFTTLTESMNLSREELQELIKATQGGSK